MSTLVQGLRAQRLWADRRQANALDGGAHWYDTYECADGGWISVGALEPQFYRLLLEKCGLAGEGLEQAQFDVANWPRHKERFAALFRTEIARRVVRAARGHRRLLRAGAQPRRGRGAPAQPRARGLRRDRRRDAAGARRRASARRRPRRAIRTGRPSAPNAAADCSELGCAETRGTDGRAGIAGKLSQLHCAGAPASRASESAARPCTTAPTSRMRWSGKLRCVGCTASLRPRMRPVSGRRGARRWALTGIASPAGAQDIEPRAYSNAPIGVNFLIAGYAYTQGGVAVRRRAAVSNPDLTTSSAVVGYARVLELWGQVGQVRRRRPAHGPVRFRGFQRGAAGPRHLRPRPIRNSVSR